MSCTPCVKKIINNGNLIAHLAPLLPGPEAAALAKAAQTYRNILHDFEIVADTSEFEGCDQARLLVAWITEGFTPVAAQVLERNALMNTWATEIWSAIADLAAGKLPE